jgi:myo-inositol-1(or 4)-monophosphatase
LPPAFHLSGRGTDEDHALFARELFNIMGVSAGVRRFGSAALDLAYVAAGRFDGYWEHGLKKLGYRRRYPVGS